MYLNRNILGLLLAFYGSLLSLVPATYARAGSSATATLGILLLGLVAAGVTWSLLHPEHKMLQGLIGAKTRAIIFTAFILCVGTYFHTQGNSGADWVIIVAWCAVLSGWYLAWQKPAPTDTHSKDEKP